MTILVIETATAPTGISMIFHSFGFPVTMTRSIMIRRAGTRTPVTATAASMAATGVPMLALRPPIFFIKYHTVLVIFPPVVFLDPISSSSLEVVSATQAASLLGSSRSHFDIVPPPTIVEARDRLRAEKNDEDPGRSWKARPTNPPRSSYRLLVHFAF